MKKETTVKKFINNYKQLNELMPLTALKALAGIKGRTVNDWLDSLELSDAEETNIQYNRKERELYVSAEYATELMIKSGVFKKEKKERENIFKTLDENLSKSDEEFIEEAEEILQNRARKLKEKADRLKEGKPPYNFEFKEKPKRELTEEERNILTNTKKYNNKYHD